VIARFCPFCGQSILAKATVCTSCGASLAGLTAQAAAPGTSPPSAIPEVTPIRQNQPAPSSPRERTSDGDVADQYALTRVNTAAIIGLVGVLVGLAALVPLPGESLGALGFLTAFIVLLTFLELTAFRRAFITLAYHDPRFSGPARYVLLLLVIVPVLLITFLAFLWLISQSGPCLGWYSALPNCANFGTGVFFGVAFAVLGVIAVIGFVGLLIGIWRLGTRYRSATFQVAAVMFPFPMLNIVAMILLLVSATTTRSRIVAEASTPDMA
jgi:uncharacterized membrane protein YkgB